MQVRKTALALVAAASLSSLSACADDEPVARSCVLVKGEIRCEEDAVDYCLYETKYVAARNREACDHIAAGVAKQEGGDNY